MNGVMRRSRNIVRVRKVNYLYLAQVWTIGTEEIFNFASSWHFHTCKYNVSILKKLRKTKSLNQTLNFKRKYLFTNACFMLSSGNVQKNQRNFIKNRLFPDAMIFDFRLLFRFFRRISDFLIGTLDIPIAFGIFFK